MGLNTSAKLGIIGTVGALLCVVGAVMYIIFPDIVNSQIKSKLKIAEDSDVYKSWKEVPIPIYMQYYFFNVTNAKEFSDNSSIKPLLQELGPFTYREYRKKVNITFNDDGTVSYNQIKWFVYDEEKSVGSLEDSVTTLNVPLVSTGLKTETLPKYTKLGLKNVVRLYKSKLFVTKTVDELLFKGYYDNLIAYLSKQSNRTILPNNTFGFFYLKNDTDDGRYTVYTGARDSSKFLQIARWNSNDTLDYWTDDYCNMINGTDGSMFQSFLKKEDTIRLFSTDLCRSVYMNYEETNNVHGIKTYRFAPPFSMMAAPDINPDNKCYCPNDNDCLLSGTLQISACRKGAPIVLSSPHFYQGDDRYYTAVDGLNRNKLEHGTILDIEPTTGAVMRAARRLQVNIRLRSVDHITPMEKLNPIIFPVFWVNESAHLDEVGAERFKKRIFSPQTIGNAVIFAVIGIGAFILVCVLLYSINVYRNKSHAVQIQSTELKATANRQNSTQNKSRKVGDPHMNLPHLKYENADKSLLQSSETSKIS